ncbi:MAG: DEAD/DEAH box helicase [Chloroflexota bacterium]|nr:DEAD/DEAH box helicase [Chloroflexota bacterium]
MVLSDVLTAFRRDPSFMRCVTAWERIPAQSARVVPWPAALAPRLVVATRDRGIERPYTHQAQAIEAALAGEHVVLSTSTASGKTLAYNLPILNTLLNDPAACALYLFPTKALAHDQISNLQSQIPNLKSPIPVRPYDGDTPSSHRPAIRREARLLVTNPDMLHTGILPHHTRWARFFGNLRYVVLDELHVYRGVFGGHVANLLRRLRRVCHFYGSDPRFLCASATIANPRELAERLIETPVTLVDDDGAPRGEKHFVLYNPPLVSLSPSSPLVGEKEGGIRRSATLVAKDIAARFMQTGVQTIVFARARLTAEVLLGYLRDAIVAAGGDLEAVQGYRGGYLPSERRAIERGLREGKLQGVVATNALELGVDIGRLGACVMAGYPGTIASAWQQAGRAGRRAGTSVAVLVASALPLDQYLVTHPRYFFGRPVEQALLDPDNLAVLANHLACAAFELPFEPGESFGSFSDAGAILDALAEDGVLHRHNGHYVWIGEGYPAAGLSLRTSTSDNIVIQDVSAGPPLVIGQMDRPSAPVLIHTGAVYLHGGATYVVESLDWEGGVARVRAAELDYYTRASSTTDVCVLEESSSGCEDEETGRQGSAMRGYGEVLVTTRATGYRKIKRYTHEVLAWEPIDLPEQELRTIGYWLALSEELTARLQESGVLPPPVDYGPDWPAQRDAARARDGYVCRHCSSPEREDRQHDVHHVTPFRAFGYVPGVNDFYKLANQLENLITLCPTCHRRVERARGARGALSGLAYLLRNLAPLHLMCDPGDLGSAVQARAPGTGLPTITLYDRAPGGVGLSVRLYELHDELLEAALDVVRRCPCADGCPGCVGPAGDVEPGTKGLTLRLLETIVRKKNLARWETSQG